MLLSTEEAERKDLRKTSNLLDPALKFCLASNDALPNPSDSRQEPSADGYIYRPVMYLGAAIGNG